MIRSGREVTHSRLPRLPRRYTRGTDKRHRECFRFSKHRPAGHVICDGRFVPFSPRQRSRCVLSLNRNERPHLDANTPSVEKTWANASVVRIKYDCLSRISITAVAFSPRHGHYANPYVESVETRLQKKKIVHIKTKIMTQNFIWIRIKINQLNFQLENHRIQIIVGGKNLRATFSHKPGFSALQYVNSTVLST